MHVAKMVNYPEKSIVYINQGYLAIKIKIKNASCQLFYFGKNN